MIPPSELKPYPAYKDSGVEWLGEVPEGWEVRRLKEMATFTGGGTPSKENQDFWRGTIPWVSPKDMARAWIVDAVDHVSEAALASSATSVVDPGAVVVVVRSGILRRALPVAINAVPVALNQDMKAIRPGARLSARYLFLLVRGKQAALLAEWTKQGATVESIEHELLANVRQPLPPVADQTAIVRYLDHIDARIQRFIAAKERLIELLEEEKQATIDSAIADEEGALWPEAPLRRFARVIDCKHLTVPFIDNGLPCISVRQVGGFEVDLESARTIDRDSFASLREGGRVPDVDDLVYCRNVNVGSCAVIATDQPFALGQDVCLIKPQAHDGRFLNYFMRSSRMKRQLQGQLIGSTFNRINVEEVKALDVVRPPIEAQVRIGRALDRSIATADTAITRARSQITLLNEYRTRLISDVVTGKLDVRAAAAVLHDDPDPDSPRIEEALEEVAL